MFGSTYWRRVKHGGRLTSNVVNLMLASLTQGDLCVIRKVTHSG